MQSGITRGDVPVTPSGGFNAPWLTVDPEPSNQKWVSGGGKTGARIEVEIPETQLENLQTWEVVCKEFGVDLWWKKALEETGGGDDSSWYVFRGKVLPAWIVKVDYFY